MTPVIYSPPRAGLPYLVVTFTADKMEALPAADRHQARLMLAQLAPKSKPTEQG